MSDGMIEGKENKSLKITVQDETTYVDWEKWIEGISMGKRIEREFNENYNLAVEELINNMGAYR